MNDARPQNEAVIQLAINIADAAARSDIESFCTEAAGSRPGRRRYDTRTCDTRDGSGKPSFIDDAVRYLALRNLIMRDAENLAIVSFPEE